jgi:DNA-binding NarL/FixJ family response regulator
MRIMLADNRPKVRFALRALLERQSGFEVVAEGADAQDLMAHAESNCPDLVLLDWELPGMAPRDLLAALRRYCPNVKIIALSGHLSVRREAMDTGADAFVSKGEPPDRLLSAIIDCGRRTTTTSGNSTASPTEGA